MKISICSSYCLGNKGDYQGLYSWLSKHGAKECGWRLAFLEDYESEGNLLAYLKQDIVKAVDLGNRRRIYAVFRRDKDRVRGTFLFGSRMTPPWAGFEDALDAEFDKE